MKAFHLFALAGLVLLLLGQGAAEAQNSVEVVPYQATEYRFKIYSPGTVPSDYGAETFDDSGFSVGDAAFGSHGGWVRKETVAGVGLPTSR
ncbi:MAG: hypothetical protein ACUVV3_04370 [Dehalococcoidia bacterium]